MISLADPNTFLQMNFKEHKGKIAFVLKKRKDF